MEKFQKEYWERKSLSERRSPENPVVKEYVVSKIEEIKKYIDITSDTKLLDVGCGNGFFTYYFDKICDTTGVDYSGKMLEMNPVNKKALMSADDLKFPDESFDVVFCHALLHHVEDIDKVINEMKRVSSKYVVILEPNRNNPLMFLFSFIVKEERKAMKFSLRFNRDMVKRNDLEIIKAFSYGMIVPNKTPKFMLPFIKLFNFKQFFGMTNFIIAKKPEN
ncbi:MAG: class I SAM-dependent methyltransferase [Thiohalospira sp.]